MQRSNIDIVVFNSDSLIIDDLHISFAVNKSVKLEIIVENLEKSISSGAAVIIGNCFRIVAIISGAQDLISGIGLTINSIINGDLDRSSSAANATTLSANSMTTARAIAIILVSFLFSDFPFIYYFFIIVFRTARGRSAGVRSAAARAAAPLPLRLRGRGCARSFLKRARRWAALPPTATFPRSLADRGYLLEFAENLDKLGQLKKIDPTKDYYRNPSFEPEYGKLVLEDMVFAAAAASCTTAHASTRRWTAQYQLPLFLHQGRPAAGEGEGIHRRHRDGDVAAMAGVPSRGGQDFAGLNQSTTQGSRWAGANLPKYMAAAEAWKRSRSPRAWSIRCPWSTCWRMRQLPAAR